MIDPHFSVLGGLIDFAGAARYGWQTYRGRVRPNLVTWVIWGAAPLIGFAASVAEGVGWNSALTLGIGLGPVVVVAAALLRGSGYWELVGFDYACGTLSVAALVLWYLSGSAGIAVGFSVAADVLATLPTILKAYRHPETESPAPYVAGVTAAGITLLSLQRTSFVYLAFPLCVFLGSSLLSALTLRRGGRRSEQSATADR